MKMISEIIPPVKLNRKKNRLLFRVLRKYPLLEFFKNDPVCFIDQYRGKIWAVFNELIRYVYKYGNNVYVSRRVIGERVGLCERQVTRITNILSKIGFITKEYFRYKIGNEFKSICKYKVNKFFKSLTAKRLLRYFFPALFANSSLLRVSQSTNQNQCPSIYNNDIFNSSLNLETIENVGQSSCDLKKRKEELKHYQKREDCEIFSTGVERPHGRQSNSSLLNKHPNSVKGLNIGNSMSEQSYKEMSRKLSAPVRQPWDNDERDNINPEEEIKKAFTLMTDEQLRFQITMGGKNKLYAETILNYRKQNGNNR